MILNAVFRTNLRVVILFIVSAAIAAHKITIDVYVHHQDWLVIYPVMEHARQWLYQTGALTLWSPFLTGGITYVSNIPFVLSMGQLLAYAGVPGVLSSMLLEWVNLSLAALCMFGLCRIYGLSRGAALTAAIIHQYFTATWLSFEGLPAGLITASFFLCERYEERGRFAYIYANTLVAGLFALTAVPHGLLIAIAFQWVVALARAANNTGRRFAVATCSSTVIGLLLALPSLLPSARDAALSYRIYYIRSVFDFSGMSFAEVLRILALVGFQIENLGPIFFVAAVLAVVSIHYLKDKKSRTIYYVGIPFVLFLCIAANGQGYVANVPHIGKLLNAFDMQRNFVTPFFAALFSGFCVHGITAQSESLTARQVKAFAVVLLLALCLWLIAGNRFREYTILGAIGLGLFLWVQARGSAETRDKYAPWFQAALAVFCVFVLAQSHIKDILLVSGKMGLSPIKIVLDDAQLRPRTKFDLHETPENARYLAETLAAATAADNSRVIDRDVFTWPQRSFLPVHHIPSMHYFDNTSSARYREFFMWMVDDIRLTKPDVYRNLWHTALFYSKGGSRYNEAMLSLGGARWILEPKELEEDRFEKVWTGSRLALYRNDKAFPKAFAVFDVKIVADKNEMASHMINASVEDLWRTVPLRVEDAKDFPRDFLRGSGQAAVSMKSYTPNEVVVDVDATENCVVVVNDNQHSTWKAAVDGQETKTFYAYNTFRMTPVPKGRHQVRFYIEDGLFYGSLRISLLVFLALTAVFGVSLFVRRRS